MSTGTHLPEFQSLFWFKFKHHSVMAKLATSSIRVKISCIITHLSVFYFYILLHDNKRMMGGPLFFKRRGRRPPTLDADTKDIEVIRYPLLLTFMA